MKLRRSIISFATALLCLTTLQLLAAEAPHRILAQKLVEDAKASHPEVVTAGIHAKRPGTQDYEIVAHTNPKSVGHKSEGADLVTLATGKPDGPNPLADGVFDVGVPLKDQSGASVGFLAVHIRPTSQSKDPKADALKSVYHISAELSAQISSLAALFQPAD
jgi:hypothetical protein